MSKTLKNLSKDIGAMTSAGLGLSLGTRAIATSGATHGEEAGLTAISGQMGLLGTIKGAALPLEMFKESFKKKK